MNKRENWMKILLSFANRCRGKMILSIVTSVISVLGGIIPFVGVYKILGMFIDGSQDMTTLLYWSGLCVLGYVVKTVFFGISTVLSHISAYTILEDIRMKIANQLMKAPLGDVTSKTIGEIKNVIIDRVEAIEPPLAHFIPEATGNIVVPLVIFIYLMMFDWRMALVSLITIPLALIVFSVMMKGFGRKYDDFVKANNHVNSVIVEYIEGIEVVKAFNQTSTSYEKFAKAVSNFKDYTVQWYKSTWKHMYLAFSILPSTLLGTLPFGLYLYTSGSLTPLQLCMCLILSLSMVAPLMRLEIFANEVKVMQYGLLSTAEYLKMRELPEVKEPVMFTNYDIKLENVHFSYTGNKEEEVLHGLDLKIRESSFNALVGPSGGGKSTVARLIARFWDVTEGDILIGGVNIKNIPLKQLADTVSFVTQDNFLFNCSLMENIRLGNPKATDNEVYEASKAACCHGFIRKLDKGYNTPAGEAGKQLSGGEKQRIAIARAILKKAPIVILDEATAFTDPENEDKIQKSVMALTEGKTLLVIAHRLSTIKDADQIIVLKKGEIVDKGTHKQLTGKSKLYSNMWNAHIGAKSWAISDKKGAIQIV